MIYSYMMRHQIGQTISNLLYDLKYKDTRFFFRATNNKNEHLICSDIVSVDHRDMTPERGLSVSQHPFYQKLFGYKYVYVVVGDVVGTGADGEPLLANCVALSRPAKTAPVRFLREHDRKTHGVSISPEEEVKINRNAINADTTWRPMEPVSLVLGF